MPLISESYRSQQEQLHELGGYGVMGGKYAPLVADIINRMEISHLLDYGCGSNLSLAEGLRKCGKVRKKLTYQAYDPGVPKYASAPVPAELVCCVDVLEHIEPECIDEVLNHLQALTEAVGFFTVDTGPARKVLSDGRNAHVLQRPVEWWLAKFCERFELQTFQMTFKSPDDFTHNKFYVIVNALPGVIEDKDGNKLK